MVAAVHRDPLDDQARRLMLASGLTRRAELDLRGQPIPRGAEGEDLLALARRLGALAPRLERAHGVRFDPRYPGVTAGVELVAGGPRLVLACAAVDAGGVRVGVVFTTLIAGRSPQVTVAPPEAPMPPGRALAAD